MAPSAVPITEQETLPFKPKSTEANGNGEPQKKKTPLEMISQGQCLPGIPTFPSYAQHRQWMLEKMALAFRVFARKGYTEGMSGHISVRDPENPHTFWVQNQIYFVVAILYANVNPDKSAWTPLRPPQSERYDSRRLRRQRHRW